MGEEERNLVKLRVAAITEGASAGTYSLVLQEVTGERRLTMSLGMAEAQQIAIFIENIRMPRPLTHDLLYSVCRAYRINVARVILEDVSEGFFIAAIVCERDGVPKVFDARTSDAVAVALRNGAPIYAREHILRHFATGASYTTTTAAANAAGEYVDMPVEELKRQIASAVEAEDYERAGRLQGELDRRLGTREPGLGIRD